MKEQTVTTLLGFDPQWMLLGLAPIFLATILAEFLYLRRRPARFPTARYTWADTVSNTVLAALYQASDAVFALLLIGIYTAAYQFRLFDISLTWGTLALLMLVQDFFYYWFHRAHHRIRWFWCSHVVHHSSERLNFSTAFRQSVTYPITGMWLFWLPIVLIGFPPEAVLFSVALSLAYQFFIHSQVVPKLGPLEWVLNTPSHHRAHHGRNPRYIDKNYGGILIIWDRLFGTFVPEEEDVIYGIPRQIRSHNPITLNFHEWRDMLREALTPGLSLWTRLQVVFGPPENAGAHQPEEVPPRSSIQSGEI
ncbi:sterol desaturase family protein [Marinobacteraceae bacterium S3BR75-40.1]